jgi:hypothetical protein
MNTGKISKRPKPHSFVQYDPGNYYAKLGISPLTPTREIKKIITRKQNDAKKRRRLHAGGKFGKEDSEFNELQKIMESFASSNKREEYDRLNPQSELLTVQWSEYDDWFDKNSQVDFVSAWMVEELGHEKILPTPRAMQLWFPGGLDAELLDFLAQFETQTGIGSHEGRAPEDMLTGELETATQIPRVVELEEIAKGRLEQKSMSSHEEKPFPDGKAVDPDSNISKNNRPQGHK